VSKFTSSRAPASIPLPGTAPRKATPPEATVHVPKEAFRTTWPGRPEAGMDVGLLRVSVADEIAARRKGDARANRMIEKFIFQGAPAWHLATLEESWWQEHDDAVMTFLVAQATCNAKSTAIPWLNVAEDNVPLALTGDGIRLVWGALRAFWDGTDPTRQAATDAELDELAARIQRGHMTTMAPGLSLTTRRLAMPILTALRMTPPAVAKTG
jgi:hypothetical protein